jgi:DNA-binding MarR family transcriptional regulator
MPPETMLLLLRTLAELDDKGRGVALTRIAKRLDLTVSTLMREFTRLSDARLGGVAGPGWVRLACEPGGRWLAHLTEQGRAQCQQQP